MKELFAFKIVQPVCQTGLRLLKVLVRLENHLVSKGVLLPGAPDQVFVLV